MQEICDATTVVMPEDGGIWMMCSMRHADSDRDCGFHEQLNFIPGVPMTPGNWMISSDLWEKNHRKHIQMRQDLKHEKLQKSLK